MDRANRWVNIGLTAVVCGAGFLMALPAVGHADSLPPDRTGKLYVTGASSNNTGVYRPEPNGTLTYEGAIMPPTMWQPQGIAVDETGNVIVVTQNVSRILRVSPDGQLLQTITHANLTEGSGIAISPVNGNRYVGNYSPPRVLIFSPTWQYLTMITVLGADGVAGIAFDPDGKFAVAATLANAIYRYSAAGVLLGTVPNVPGAHGIANDAAGNHYVSCANANEVRKYSSSWNLVQTITAPTMSGPQAIVFDSNGDFTVTNFLQPVANRFNAQGTWLSSFPLIGVASGRYAAYQTDPQIVARRGSVNAANQYPVPILLVSVNNGPPQTGDARHRVMIPLNTPFTISLAASPAGPSPANFVLYGMNGEPTAAEVTVLPLTFLPQNFNVLAFPTSLTSASTAVIANTLSPLLGSPVLNVPPAPTTIYASSGVGAAGTLTLQGLILDTGAPAPSGAPSNGISVTNALVLIFQ